MINKLHFAEIARSLQQIEAIYLHFCGGHDPGLLYSIHKARHDNRNKYEYDGHCNFNISGLGWITRVSYCHKVLTGNR